MTASSATPGTLYIVATPIGNLEDISQRAIHTLNSVDAVLAEDTRHSQQLLNALGIKKPLTSLHAFNEAEKSEQIVSSLLRGQSWALVSDAGTPLISDPGYPLVKRARQQTIPVVPIPGPCAFITALSAAGVACDAVTFCGFLPPKAQARRQKLERLRAYDHTLVFYESTHRIIDCLNDMADVFSETCQVVLAKELTKTFERFIAGTCREVQAWLLGEPNRVKGEFVLIIPARTLEKEAAADEKVLAVLLEELPVKQAAKIASKLTGTNKNELYQLALKMK